MYLDLKRSSPRAVGKCLVAVKQIRTANDKTNIIGSNNRDIDLREIEEVEGPPTDHGSEV